MSTRAVSLLVTFVTLALSAACYDGGRDKAGARPADPPPSVHVTDLPGHDGLAVDRRQLRGPRLMAAEVYLRSYQMLFGGVSPREIAEAAKGTDRDELFHSWSEHLSPLGLPDYAADLARSTDTNTLMLATYERLGIALCDRAVERDLRGASPRSVFDFDAPARPLSRDEFAARFDSLHRTFLGYPADRAGARTDRFFDLYGQVVARHESGSAPPSRFTPVEAGWAVVCYGLVRHPEFHFY